MAKIRFWLFGDYEDCIAEAPEDMTLKELLKQCDRMQPIDEHCSRGLRSARKCDESRKTDVFFEKDSVALSGNVDDCVIRRDGTWWDDEAVNNFELLESNINAGISEARKSGADSITVKIEDVKNLHEHIKKLHGMYVDRTKISIDSEKEIERLNGQLKESGKRHGFWILTGMKTKQGGTIIDCSCCNARLIVANVSDEKYCRTCGARMDLPVKGCEK